MRQLRSALLALGCSWLASAHAQQAEQGETSPDLEFLEYLGAWAEEDDEWLAIEEWERDNGAKPDEGSDGEDRKRSERRPKGDDDEGE